jgi:hypothetical protein
MSKAELDEIKGRSMTKGLPKWKRWANIKKVKEYLKDLMNESENYMLFYRDVAIFIETMLFEGLFKNLKEPEQRMVVSLYPENKKMVLYDLERVLKEHGEKKSQEVFWRMVAEYKTAPKKQPDVM